MRNFSLLRRLMCWVCLVLFLADGVFAWYIWKRSNSAENPKLALMQETRQLGLLKADVKRAAEIREKIPGYLKEFDAFESSFPPATKGYSMISQEMGEIAKNTHLLVEAVRFHEKQLKERGLEEVEGEATVSGDYQSIVRFLNGLQRSHNVYIIDSLAVDLQNVTQGAAPGALKVSLHFKTYFRNANG